MENKLNELNIFALRDLGRRMGVSSPTSKKKEEIIKNILEIMSGQTQPNLNKTKQGRPPKTFGYDFANVFSFNSLNQISLSQPAKQYNDDQVSTIVGYVELVNNNSAILWVNKDFKNENYFISSNVLKDVDVRTGDKVVVEICFEDNQYVVKGIFNINDCPINQMKIRKSYEEINHVSLEKSLKFSNSKFQNYGLNFADNIYCYGEDNKHNTLGVIDILNACEAKQKVYLNISLTDKNKTLLNGLKNAEIFVADITEKLENIRRIISLSIERAKRLFEHGEDVVFVVDDMLSIVGVDNENLNLVKTLASISKQSKKGSITLLAVMPNDSIIQIEKLADKRLKI